VCMSTRGSREGPLVACVRHADYDWAPYGTYEVVYGCQPRIAARVKSLSVDLHESHSCIYDPDRVEPSIEGSVRLCAWPRVVCAWRRGRPRRAGYQDVAAVSLGEDLLGLPGPLQNETVIMKEIDPCHRRTRGMIDSLRAHAWLYPREHSRRQHNTDARSCEHSSFR
jgi:hypothetical protein